MRVCVYICVYTKIFFLIPVTWQNQNWWSFVSDQISFDFALLINLDFYKFNSS